MAQTKRESIEIPAIEIGVFEITLIGETELITHAWSAKAKKEMLDKQMGVPKGAKAKKDPRMDYLDSMYWLSKRPDRATDKQVSKATFGFPSTGLKSAAVSSCRSVDGIKMTEARNAFHVSGEFVTVDAHPHLREDMVVLNGKTADLRYRGGFFPWSITFEVRHDANFLTAPQIVNLFNKAGFGVGIGEWRPERNGWAGRFHVATDSELRRKAA
jgi:hypothetical protein